MSTTAKVSWVDGALFVAEGGSGHTLTMDGAPDIGGRNLASRPMEVVLMGIDIEIGKSTKNGPPFVLRALPLAWAMREGDPVFGMTWHRMDAELDTGNILAQGSIPIEDDDVDIKEFSPRLQAASLALLPQALERVAAGDPGDPQSNEGASWAGHFEDDDYVRVDWSRPARDVHNQVRAWHLTFGMSGLRAPVAELDGGQVVLLQTRLADPGGEARRVECGDGPIWIVASEPA